MSACSDHERDNEHKFGYRRAFPFKGFFLKFDSHNTFKCEVMTLQYVSELAAKDSNAPRVPQVLHYFHEPQGMGYLVMDLIQFAEVSFEDLAEKAAHAVRWMRTVPVPDDVILGPRGGGLMSHIVFRDYKAPRKYRSIIALERYLNKVSLSHHILLKKDWFFF